MSNAATIQRTDIQRFMGVSAIKDGKEDAFLHAFAEGSEELRRRLNALSADACSMFRLGRYVFLYAEFGAGAGSAAQGFGASIESGVLPEIGAQSAIAAAERAAVDPDPARTGAESLWSEELRALLEPWPSLLGGETEYVQRLNDIFHDDVPMDDVPWRRPDWKPTRRQGKLARLKPDMYASYVFLHYQLQEELPRGFSKYYTIGSFGPYIFSYEEQPSTVEPKRSGRLSTAETPGDWHAVMHPHFEPWPGSSGDDQLWREMEALFHLVEQE